MQTQLALGTTMPVLEVLLKSRTSVFSESGERAFSWMTLRSIQMMTHTQAGGGTVIFSR